jgi:hypothetical protein
MDPSFGVVAEYNPQPPHGAQSRFREKPRVLAHRQSSTFAPVRRTWCGETAFCLALGEPFGLLSLPRGRVKKRELSLPGGF